MGGRMNVRLLDSNGHKWSCELFIGNKWFASVGGFDSEDEAVRQANAIAARWNGCEDALGALEHGFARYDTVPEEDSIFGRTAALLRRAINREG